jgi:Methyltransferase domain
MTALVTRIEALDTDLFSFVPIQATAGDARALLALEAAVGASNGSFSYLEIGSFRGGSLQVLIRDPKCSCLMSIDARTGETLDAGRGVYAYEENTTARMLEFLSQVPEENMEKLSTFETTTQAMSPASLPKLPDFCFVDGEHTHEAVLHDARFCAEAMGGTGVIAFHDYEIVESAIKAFVREHWRQISLALPLSAPSTQGHGVFALEMGDKGVLRHPAIDRAIGSRSHRILWRAANRPRRPAMPLLLMWAAMPAIELVLNRVRHLVRR